MNIKKEAYKLIIENLRKQVSDIDLQISRNKSKFRDLEYEQGILKRMKAEIVKLLGIVQKDRDTMKAIDVLTAAKKTFAAYGNDGYAKNKSNQFLRRCGAKLEDGPNQPIDQDRVKEVVFAMLDTDSEKLFWENLEGGRQ